ncbi:MAG: hypothetical protein ACPG7F_17965 [Aggregatilineales bacterium]
MAMAIFRRILLGISVLVLLPSIAILLGVIQPDIDAPIDTIAIISTVIAGLLSIVSAGLEIRAISENIGMPDPEDPPMSVLPDLSRYQKTEEIKIMEDAIKSVEDAEEYAAHHSNGHVKVSIEVDVDDSDDETEL